MNKIQYVKLLELRGITELKGVSIAEAVKNSGGDPTDKEMAEVNFKCMQYYMERFNSESNKNLELTQKVEELEKRSNWLSCLESAGVDNWEGFDIAIDIRDGNI